MQPNSRSLGGAARLLGNCFCARRSGVFLRKDRHFVLAVFDLARQVDWPAGSPPAEVTPRRKSNTLKSFAQESFIQRFLRSGIGSAACVAQA